MSLSLLHPISLRIQMVAGYKLYKQYHRMNKKKQIGKYYVHMDKEIGEGDHGTVYEGEVCDSHQKMAIKVISKSRVDSNSRKAIMQEVENMFALKSPYIISVNDILESKNNYYIVQQYCNESNLRKAIETKGPFSEEQSINILKQICNGFTKILSEGIIHRDLKPENIMFHNGTAKISDFGYSRRLLENKQNLVRSKILISPAYKSPEILKSRPYTRKCDIWSIGIILYEMLHKRPPWLFNTIPELIQRIEIQPLKISPEFHPNIQSFLTSCLEVKEENRMEWDQLYKHPIFEDYFLNYNKTNQSYENKLKSVLNQLRFLISSSNVDIEKLFDAQGLKKDSQLTFESFRKFLKILEVPVTFAECKYVFEAIDQDGNHLVCLSQLESILEKHNVPMKSQLLVPQRESVQMTGEQVAEYKLRESLIKVSKQLAENKKELYQYFDGFDINKFGDLTLIEFSSLIKSLDPTFTVQQIQHSFQLMDSSSNGNISFKQFNKFYCNCMGIPASYSYPYQRA